MKYRETKTFKYDGWTTRSYEDIELTEEEAVKKLEELSEKETLLYEALNRIRSVTYSENSDFASLVHSMVNYAILYVYHRDSEGKRNHKVYREALEADGINMSRFFFDEEEKE